MPRFDANSVQNLTPEAEARIEFARASVSWRQVFDHFGLVWRSDSEHQFSCPLHARYTDSAGQPVERNPSAHYYAKDGRVWCFACDEGGDVVWFFQRRLKLSFGEALRRFWETFNLGDPSLGELQIRKLERQAQQKVQRTEVMDSLLMTKSQRVVDAFWLLELRFPHERDRIQRTALAVFSNLYEGAARSGGSTEVIQWSRWAADLLEQVVRSIQENSNAAAR